MSDPISAILDRVLVEEGDAFTNDPKDPGGPTKYGITQAALADFRGKPVTAEDVESMTRAEAWAVLYQKYVRAPKFDEVAKRSLAIGAKLIDSGVNLGQPTVAMFLQRCLNALNLNATKYPDVAVDGILGPGSLSALSAFLAWRKADGETVMTAAITCLQGEKYIELAEKRPIDEAYLYGWLQERVVHDA